jgi:DASH complex subunit Spc34
VAESVAIYEAKVTSQTAQLDRMNKTTDNDPNHEEGEDRVASVEAHRASVTINDDDLRAEEQEIRELEQKKLALEERVASMEKDLGGLLR